MLVDDHPALRMGLRIMLEQAPDIQVVAEAGTGEEALAQIQALLPDVAVLDCQLPGMSGMEVAAEIRRLGLPVRVLALSAYTDDQVIQGMIQAGAVGYLLKEEAPAAIVDAVRAAARGEGRWSAAVASKLAAWSVHPPQAEPGGDLTDREIDVLRLLAERLGQSSYRQGTPHQRAHGALSSAQHLRQDRRRRRGLRPRCGPCGKSSTGHEFRGLPACAKLMSRSDCCIMNEAVDASSGY